MGDQVQQIRDSFGRLAELNSPAMITEDFVKYCIDRIDIRAEGDVMKLTISLVTGKMTEKQLDAEKEPSPQNRNGSWRAEGSERSAYCCPLMARSACSMRRFVI